MTSIAAPALEPETDTDLELYDVVFTDDLGAQETTVIASCHDDAADQVAFNGESILATTRRSDGDTIDHSLEATYALAQAIGGPDGAVIDAGDSWLIKTPA